MFGSLAELKMSSILSHNEHHLKTRSLKLAPKRCMAISFGRQSTSSLPSTPSSSLSVTSDIVECGEVVNHRHHHHPHTDRQVPFCATSRQSNECQNVSPVPDKQSFTSTSSNITNADCLCQQPINCVELFNEFVRENSGITCFPLNNTNTTTSSLCKLDLVGFLYPTTLLLNGSEDSLESLSCMWSKRILRAPTGYYIRFLGNTSVLEVTTISQSHFTPLAEALHKCIDELNSLQLEATFETIVKRLFAEFPSMELPSEDILKSSLNTMLSENKLSFDYHKQVYFTTRSPPLTPWDEFENLSISDNTKNDKEAEEIELEYKSIDNEISRCEASEGLFYDKSKTLSSESSFAELNHLISNQKVLRRNSSLSGELHQFPVEGKFNFKRSKSFKLSNKENSNELNEMKKCTCDEIIIKRQSLLSKLLKFGQSNGHAKARSSLSSSSTSSIKYANFGAQFPEKSDNKTITLISGDGNKTVVEMQSRATQTVKSGPEEIVKVIMKQAGKHALVRNRSLRHSERSSSEGCSSSRYSRHCKCHNCDSSLSYLANKYKESRSNNSRRSKPKCYNNGDCNECFKYHNDLHDIPIDLYSNQLSRHRERHRKTRSDSLKQSYRRNSFDDEEPSHLTQNTHNSTHRSHNGTSRNITRQLMHNVVCNKFDNVTDEDVEYINHNNQTQCAQMYRINPTKKDLNFHQNKIHLNRSLKESNNHQQDDNVQQCANLLINNSLNLKIEIETSNLNPTKMSNNEHIKIEDIQTRKHHGNTVQLIQLRDTSELSDNTEMNETMHNFYNKRNFANDIYSELCFDSEPPKITECQNQKEYNGSHRPAFNPEMDYTNSIVALKEHLARAKANFFNAPLSPQT